jgi:hypothetical protein
MGCYPLWRYNLFKKGEVKNVLVTMLLGKEMTKKVSGHVLWKRGD